MLLSAKCAKASVCDVTVCGMSRLTGVNELQVLLMQKHFGETQPSY